MKHLQLRSTLRRWTDVERRSSTLDQVGSLEDPEPERIPDPWSLELVSRSETKTSESRNRNRASEDLRKSWGNRSVEGPGHLSGCFRTIKTGFPEKSEEEEENPDRIIFQRRRRRGRIQASSEEPSFEKWRRRETGFQVFRRNEIAGQKFRKARHRRWSEDFRSVESVNGSESFSFLRWCALDLLGKSDFYWRGSRWSQKCPKFEQNRRIRSWARPGGRKLFVRSRKAFVRTKEESKSDCPKGVSSWSKRTMTTKHASCHHWLLIILIVFNIKVLLKEIRFYRSRIAMWVLNNWKVPLSFHLMYEIVELVCNVHATSAR